MLFNGLPYGSLYGKSFDPYRELYGWLDFTNSETVDATNDRVTEARCLISGETFEPDGAVQAPSKVLGAINYDASNSKLKSDSARWDNMAKDEKLRIVIVCQPYFPMVNSLGFPFHKGAYYGAFPDFLTDESKLQLATWWNAYAGGVTNTTPNRIVTHNQKQIFEFDFAMFTNAAQAYPGLTCDFLQEILTPSVGINQTSATPVDDASSQFALGASSAAGSTYGQFIGNMFEVQISKGGMHPEKRIAQMQYLQKKHGISSLASREVLKLLFAWGQSNMVGNKDTADATRQWIIDEDPIAKAIIYDYTEGTPANRLKAYQPGVTNISFELGNLDPLATMLKRIADEQDQKIGVIKYSTGGTGINSHWKPNANDGLYYNLINSITAPAKNVFEAGGYLIDPRAILQHQGETESVLQADANAYQGHNEDMIDNMRADIHKRTLTPDYELPYIIGGINPSANSFPYNATVKAAHAALASSKDKAFYFNNDDLTTPDEAHFTAEGTEIIGDRYYANGVGRALGHLIEGS